MNSFYEKHKIPTDFVYTGKMIAAFYELLKINFFPEKSRILLIHSGGLQGNRSLKNHELIF
jgi:1-aminocyclopropane-1-carboxylate deaminase/D-cysteine desulfhydrase-like pyridoxal-dependent ACC family enzyme